MQDLKNKVGLVNFTQTAAHTDSSSHRLVQADD